MTTAALMHYRRQLAAATSQDDADDATEDLRQAEALDDYAADTSGMDDDAGWAQFTNIIRAKAEKAGREVVAVDPRGTSQECSGCGAVVKKGLGVRVHACTCGLVLDRDTNAAINIKNRLGQSRRGGLNESDEPRSPYLPQTAR